MEVPEPHAERQGDRDGDRQCGAREHEVLPRLLEDESALVDDELERVREHIQVEAGDQVVLRALLQGVSARSASTRSASATSARATASAPAAMISVLNASRSARKIG